MDKKLLDIVMRNENRETKVLPEKSLAVDYGRAKCGLAWSPDGATDLPIGVISAKDIKAQIQQIITEKDITHIYYGLPKNGDGSEGDLCAEIRQLAGAVGRKHDFVNEWGSTSRTIRDDDSLSACRILGYARRKFGV